jgi:diguanylate cyclase (GGDEF)-like protein
MHEEDRERVVNFCVSQSKAGVDHEADYRALTSGGKYVWIRDVVHVVRNLDGQVDSLIGFMFDITDRKENEEKILCLQKELEELSFKDSLTNVANRRMFDKLMEVEWHSARRQHLPLSVLMIDIDFFKQYNDLYGHIQGDECLCRVAEILNNVGTRPRDFLARLGGEEFIIVLPEADLESAVAIAERCRILILQEQIPHTKSEVADCLTISIGAGTVVPTPRDELKDFINLVDRNLYRAKQNGRNRVEA